jgi:hypothetical protein
MKKHDQTNITILSCTWDTLQEFINFQDVQLDYFYSLWLWIWSIWLKTPSYLNDMFLFIGPIDWNGLLTIWLIWQKMNTYSKKGWV